MYKITKKTGEVFNINANSYSIKDGKYVFMANESYSANQVEVFTIDINNVSEVLNESVSGIDKSEMLYS